MVSIVVVSHSAKLAAGVAELARQMSQEGCQLAIAAGIDDPEHPIGTDAMKVMEAIQQVFDPAGVVVMMDMGSALLNAETALELLSAEMADKVRLCAAPLVEGTVAASIAAAAGQPLEQVIAEANDALIAKQAQLQASPRSRQSSALPAADASARDDDRKTAVKQLKWTVQNQQGLHARPAAQLVSVLNPFASEFVLEKNGQQANPRSINQIAALQVRCGDGLLLRAKGPDADAAISAVKQLVDANFGEEVARAQAQKITPARPMTNRYKDRIQGIPVSGGIAWGLVQQCVLTSPPAPLPPGDPRDELRRLKTALRSAHSALQHLTIRLASVLGPDVAAIFEAQLLVLGDTELYQAVKDRIGIRKQRAEDAWQAEIDTLAATYRALDDEYLRARELDIHDIGKRISDRLAGRPEQHIALNQPVILVADELFPSTIASLDRELVHGICLSTGNPLSHSAIIAKALRIPTVVQAKDCLQRTRPGQHVYLDGTAGILWLSPDPKTRIALEKKGAEPQSTTSAEEPPQLG